MNGMRFWASLGLVAISFGLGGCSAPNSVGRYQQLGENRVIDTTTGSVWQYEPISSEPSGQQEFGWRSLGNPARQPTIPAQQTVASPPVSQPPESQPADPFPNASQAKSLAMDLSALKAMKDEGNLTDAEYNPARDRAVGDFDNLIQGQQLSTSQLHDELGLITQMYKDHRLNDDQYKLAKAAIVKHLQPQGQ